MMRGHTRSTTLDPHTGQTRTSTGWYAILPWVWPMGVAVVALVAGHLVHWLYGPDRGPIVGAFVAVAVLLIFGVLTAVTLIAARPRGIQVQIGATSSVIVVGLWMVSAVIVGVNAVTFAVWLLILLASAGYPLVKALRSGHSDGGDALSDAIKTPVRVLSAQRTGSEVSGVMETRPGVTAAELRRKTENVASFAGVAPDAVNIDPDPNNARRATFSIRTGGDLLKHPIPWPGPSRPGGTMMEPLLLGKREDDRPMEIYIPGDASVGRPGGQISLSGISNGGKTTLLRLLGAEILSRRDAEMHIIDTAKGMQFFGPFKDRVNGVHTNVHDADRMLHAIPEEIDWRARHLGERDRDMWVTGCGIPCKIIIIDELAAFIAGNADRAAMLVRIVDTCRSVGIHLIMANPRWVAPAVPVALRVNVGTHIAFGCKDGEEAYGLSAAAIAAGATPHRWGNKMPGYCYLEAATVPEHELALRYRTFQAGPAEIRAALQEHQWSLPTGGDEAYSPVPPPPPPLALVPMQPTPPPAAEQLRDHLNDLVAAGKTEIRPADFDSIRDRHGLSPAWLSGQLARMVDDGVLTKTDVRGVYQATGGAA